MSSQLRSDKDKNNGCSESKISFMQEQFSNEMLQVYVSTLSACMVNSAVYGRPNHRGKLLR